MKRILFINPFGIGDALFTMRAVQATRQANPGVFIGFLCNERTADLVRMNSDIDETFVFNRDYLRKLLKEKPISFFAYVKNFLKMLKSRRFDTSVDFSLGREYSFYAFLIGIPKRLGLDYKNRGLFLTKKMKIAGYEGRSVADTQLELLKEAGILIQTDKAPLALHIPEFKTTETEHKLKKECPGKSVFIGIAPGGGKSWGADASFKQWDSRRFAEAASKWADSHSAAVLVFGSPDERRLLEDTAAQILPGARIVCQDNFQELCAYIKKCTIFLANDGGLAHLADALNVPTFTIFGPVDEKAYAPYSAEGQKNVLFADVPCRPCYQKFRFRGCGYEKQCLTKIEVRQVLEKMKK